MESQYKSRLPRSKPWEACGREGRTREECRWKRISSKMSTLHMFNQMSMLHIFNQDQCWYWQLPPKPFLFSTPMDGNPSEHSVPYLLTVNFKNDKPISKMWINDYSWMTRKFYLPLKLNLSRWKMGRNWSWGGIAGEGVGMGFWVHFGLGHWDAVYCSFEFTEESQTWICPFGVFSKLWLTILSRLAKVQCCSLLLQK